MQAVIEGDAFHTQSPLARNVLCAAEKLDGWLKHPENCLPAKEFSSWLLSTLKACVPCNISSTRMREKMWSAYHQLRCSSSYVSKWQCFLKQSLGVESHPILYQSIGNAILDQVVTEKCHVSDTLSSTEQPSITEQELNALRYAAGYIPRALSKKQRSQHIPSKMGCSCVY